MWWKGNQTEAKTLHRNNFILLVLAIFQASRLRSMDPEHYRHQGILEHSIPVHTVAVRGTRIEIVLLTAEVYDKMGATAAARG